MSGGNIIVQVAPMGHVARVALQEQEAAMIKQQALQQITPEKLQKDNEQVAKTSGGEAGQKVKRRQDERKRHAQEEFSGQQGQKQSAADEEEPGVMGAVSAEPTGNVWAGNIINVKV